jgi:hypothetical protein
MQLIPRSQSYTLNSSHKNLHSTEGVQHQANVNLYFKTAVFCEEMGTHRFAATINFQFSITILIWLPTIINHVSIYGIIFVIMFQIFRI